MIINATNFNLEHVFECGQCFRWNKNYDGSYTGVVNSKCVTIKAVNGNIEIDDNSDYWHEYFDLNTDYSKIINQLSNDKILKSAIKKGEGIRILKQEFFETVISFIISQNNNIPRIKNIIEKLCEKYGEKINDKHYAFPKPEVLAGVDRQDLAFLKAGYRDSYIIDASVKIAGGMINKDIIYNDTIENARKEISKIKGVGPKVADCILLFSAARGEVFPTDVWMKKVLTTLYGFNNLTPKAINEFAEKSFGNLAGYAQQYLFYSMREGK